MGYWGWTQHQGPWRFVWGIGLPIVAMALWGTFRVPGDPGDAPVAVSGVVRLALEGVEFGAAVWLLIASGRLSLGIGFGVVILLHYIVSYDRVGWLLRGRRSG
jgi:hypothetical protein